QTGFQFKADVAVKYRAEMVDGKSLLSVLALGVSCGAEVEVSVYGCDASQAMQAIEHLFNHAFCAGEEPVPQECTVAT
ncbi:MAG: HPr family phosphocarrier protein, partial [Kiritimatiellaeota bacterium]|nr:HPr family phosphocarrier protein [Kiritimatiellota bacterium]